MRKGFSEKSAQYRAVVKDRKVLRERGMSRFEVRALERDKQLIRDLGEKGFFKNNIMRISVVFLVVMALQIAVYAIPVLLPFLFKIGTLGTASQPVWIFAATQGFHALAQSFIVPLSLLATTMFYFDVRIRYEGLDMELRAKAHQAAASPRT